MVPDRKESSYSFYFSLYLQHLYFLCIFIGLLSCEHKILSHFPFSTIILNHFLSLIFIYISYLLPVRQPVSQLYGFFKISFCVFSVLFYWRILFSSIYWTWCVIYHIISSIFRRYIMVNPSKTWKSMPAIQPVGLSKYTHQWENYKWYFLKQAFNIKKYIIWLFRHLKFVKSTHVLIYAGLLFIT